MFMMTLTLFVARRRHQPNQSDSGNDNEAQRKYATTHDADDDTSLALSSMYDTQHDLRALPTTPNKSFARKPMPHFADVAAVVVVVFVLRAGNSHAPAGRSSMDGVGRILHIVKFSGVLGRQ